MPKFALKSALSLAALQLLLSPVASYASTVKFAAPGNGQPGALQAHLPIYRLNGLKLPSGAVTIQDRTIEIGAVPEWLFDPQMVLSGVVINSSLTVNGSQATVSGLAYFMGGDWLPYLNRSRMADAIDTTSGATYRGRIGAATDTGVEVLLVNGTRKLIPFAEIASIASPRAFSFSIPASGVKIDPQDNSMQAESNLITMTPSVFAGHLAHRDILPPSRLAGTEGQLNKSVLAAMITADVSMEIAPFIAGPLVFGSGQANNKQILRLWHLQSLGIIGPNGLPQSGIP